MIKPEDTFNTLKDVYDAAWRWYGKQDRDSCCLAEVRLMKGERPPKKEDNG